MAASNPPPSEEDISLAGIGSLLVVLLILAFLVFALFVCLYPEIVTDSDFFVVVGR